MIAHIAPAFSDLSDLSIILIAKISVSSTEQSNIYNAPFLILFFASEFLDGCWDIFDDSE